MTTVAEMAQWFRKAFDETQSQMLAEATIRLHEDLVHREDFTKLTTIVERLADRTDHLAERTDRLAEAQERTEVRLDRLAEAQERTEVRLDRLAEQMQELAHEMKGLTRAMKDTRKQMGGLAQTVGYGLEAYAMDKIPQVLTSFFKFAVQSSKPEHFTAADGTKDEIDTVVRGTLAGKPAVFLCEVKTNITAKEVADFLPVADRVAPQLGCDDVRILYFAYRAGSQARQAVADVGASLAFPHDLIVTQQG